MRYDAEYKIIFCIKFNIKCIILKLKAIYIVSCNIASKGDSILFCNPVRSLLFYNNVKWLGFIKARNFRITNNAFSYASTQTRG